MSHDNFRFERSCIKEGLSVAGIDEVGRGSIAGPVVAAVVVVSSVRHRIKGVEDSKVLSRSKREELFNVVKRNCKEYAFGSARPKEIDRLGIGKATAKAMEMAFRKLKCKPDKVLIDGARITRPNIKATMIKHGDKLHYSISAASIIAKVHRDRIMIRLSKKYPGYGFDHNVGYGTEEHRKAIRKYGITKIHRKSFSPIKGNRG